MDEPNFKIVKPKPVILKAKESVRKLPMFENFNDDVNYYDFEWPNRINLKTVNEVKQLKLKEIRYH